MSDPIKALSSEDPAYKAAIREVSKMSLDVMMVSLRASQAGVSRTGIINGIADALMKVMHAEGITPDEARSMLTRWAAGVDKTFETASRAVLMAMEPGGKA